MVTMHPTLPLPRPSTGTAIKGARPGSSAWGSRARTHWKTVRLGSLRRTVVGDANWRILPHFMMKSGTRTSSTAQRACSRLGTNSSRWRRVLDLLARQEIPISLVDHDASSERQCSLREHSTDTSAPKSRGHAHVCDKPSGEKHGKRERGETIT